MRMRNPLPEILDPPLPKVDKETLLCVCHWSMYVHVVSSVRKGDHVEPNKLPLDLPLVLATLCSLLLIMYMNSSETEE